MPSLTHALNLHHHFIISICYLLRTQAAAQRPTAAGRHALHIHPGVQVSPLDTARINARLNDTTAKPQAANEHLPGAVIGSACPRTPQLAPPRLATLQAVAVCAYSVLLFVHPIVPLSVHCTCTAVHASYCGRNEDEASFPELFARQLEKREAASRAQARAQQVLALKAAAAAMARLSLPPAAGAEASPGGA